MSHGVSPVERLPEGLPEALARPGAHPCDTSAADGVEARQTHISHLFLTRKHVYKLRKAVDLSFLSFATREERNADCLREVSLNRRLAPDVYLGLAPALPDSTNDFVLGPIGETCVTPPSETRPAEHCVVMRRLPEGRDALCLLQRGELSFRQVERLADLLARFHRQVGLGCPAPFAPAEWLARIETPVRASFALARDAGASLFDLAELERLEKAMQEILEHDRAGFLSRRDEGRAVDGHGDLHLDAVWFEHEDADPVAIDCLEFDAELRRIDSAAELAFFAMDTAYRARADLGEHLLRAYAARADDYGLYGVVDFHILHRALVRAGVAALATREIEIAARQRAAAAESARRHIELMAHWLDRPHRPAVLLTTGLSGTGKSSIAAEAENAIGGVGIASDRVRKHLAGLPVDAHAPDQPGFDLYSEARTEAVYAGLLERAEPVLSSGRPVILDATYSSRAEREKVRARCQSLGIPVLLLEARCKAATALARLRARLDDPQRISDAGPAVYRAQQGRYQPPTEWGPEQSIVVHTDSETWRTDLRTRLRRSGMEENPQ